jgi:large subunit ribosomal protein L29
MKVADIRKMTVEEIEKNVQNLREEYGNLSFQHRIRPLENPSRLRKIKRDIARLETIKRQSTN